MPQFTHTIYHPKDRLIFYPLDPSFMLIGQLIDEIGLLIDEILNQISIIQQLFTFINRRKAHMFLKLSVAFCVITVFFYKTVSFPFYYFILILYFGKFVFVLIFFIDT